MWQPHVAASTASSTYAAAPGLTACQRHRLVSTTNSKRSTTKDSSTTDTDAAATSERKMQPRISRMSADSVIDTDAVGDATEQAASSEIQALLSSADPPNLLPGLLASISNVSTSAPAAQLAAAATVQLAHNTVTGGAAAAADALLNRKPPYNSNLAAVLYVAMGANSGAAPANAAAACQVVAAAAGLTGPSSISVPVQQRVQLLEAFRDGSSFLLDGLQHRNICTRALAANILLRLSERPACRTACIAAGQLAKLVAALSMEREQATVAALLLAIRNFIRPLALDELECAMQKVDSLQPLVDAILQRHNIDAAVALCSIAGTATGQCLLLPAVPELLLMCQQQHVQPDMVTCIMCFTCLVSKGSRQGSTAVLSQASKIWNVIQQYSGQMQQAPVITACHVLLALLETKPGQQKLVQAELVRALAAAIEPIPTTSELHSGQAGGNSSSRCIHSSNTAYWQAAWLKKLAYGSAAAAAAAVLLRMAEVRPSDLAAGLLKHIPSLRIVARAMGSCDKSTRAAASSVMLAVTSQSVDQSQMVLTALVLDRQAVADTVSRMQQGGQKAAQLVSRIAECKQLDNYLLTHFDTLSEVVYHKNTAIAECAAKVVTGLIERGDIARSQGFWAGVQCTSLSPLVRALVQAGNKSSQCVTGGATEPALSKLVKATVYALAQTKLPELLEIAKQSASELQLQQLKQQLAEQRHMHVDTQEQQRLEQMMLSVMAESQLQQLKQQPKRQPEQQQQHQQELCQDCQAQPLFPVASGAQNLPKTPNKQQQEQQVVLSSAVEHLAILLAVCEALLTEAGKFHNQNKRLIQCEESMEVLLQLLQSMPAPGKGWSLPPYADNLRAKYFSGALGEAAKATEQDKKAEEAKKSTPKPKPDGSLVAEPATGVVSPSPTTLAQSQNPTASPKALPVSAASGYGALLAGSSPASSAVAAVLSAAGAAATPTAAPSAAAEAALAATKVLHALGKPPESGRNDFLFALWLLEHPKGLEALVPAMFVSDDAVACEACSLMRIVTGSHTAPYIRKDLVTALARDHLEKLLPHLQQGSELAFLLLDCITQESAGRAKLLTHHQAVALPALLVAAGKFSHHSQAAAAVPAASVLHKLTIDVKANTDDMLYAWSPTASNDLDGQKAEYSGDHGQIALATHAGLLVSTVIPGIRRHLPCCFSCAACVYNVCLRVEGQQAVAAAGGVAALMQAAADLEQDVRTPSKTMDLVLKAVYKIADGSDAGCGAVMSCLDNVIQGLHSSNMDMVCGVLLVLHSLTNSKCVQRKEVLKQLYQQQSMAKLIEFMQQPAAPEGSAAAAAGHSALIVVDRISAEADGKQALLQHLPALLAVLGSAGKGANTAALNSAAFFIHKLTFDECAPVEGTEGGAGAVKVVVYSGELGQEALAALGDIGALVQGLLDNAGYSDSCAAALFNMTLVAAGKAAVRKHVGELLEATQPQYSDYKAQRALDAVRMATHGGAEDPVAALLPHVQTLIAAVSQQKRSEKVLRAAFRVMLDVLRSPEGLEVMVLPEYLQPSLTRLVPMAGRQEYAARCILVLSDDDEAREAIVPHVQQLVSAIRKEAPEQQEQEAESAEEQVATSIVLSALALVAAGGGEGIRAVAKCADDIVAVASTHPRTEVDAAFFMAQYNVPDPASAACNLLHQLVAADRGELLGPGCVESVLEYAASEVRVDGGASKTAAKILWCAAPSCWEALCAPNYMASIMGGLAPGEDAGDTAIEVAQMLENTLQDIASAAAAADKAPGCVQQLLHAIGPTAPVQQRQQLLQPVVQFVSVMSTCGAGQLAVAANRDVLEAVARDAAVPRAVCESIRDILRTANLVLEEKTAAFECSVLSVREKGVQVALAYVAYCRAHTKEARQAAVAEWMGCIWRFQQENAVKQQLQQQLKSAAAV